MNIERLQEIAKVLDTKAEDILAFNEKYIFNSYDRANGPVNNFNSFPIELKSLYEDKITLLEEKVKFLQEKVAWLEQR